MLDPITAQWIAALKRARAELEIVLSGDEDWLALGASSSGPSHSPAKGALAASPVYRCWEQLSGAIEDLLLNSVAHAGAQSHARRQRIELRHVLEHIQSEAALGEPPQPVLDIEWAQADVVRGLPLAMGDTGSTLPGAPESGVPLLEPEEAEVSFVIREPEPPVRVAGSQGRRSPHSVRPAKAPQPTGPADTQGEPPGERGAEAEVVIVSRPR
jgi:hypothetical protein